jgi:CBS domain-containing protein
VATLGELMTKEVLEVAPEDTLGQAAEAMVERGVGSAVVSDFMRAVAGRVHSSEARVREWMTAEPVTASASTELKEAAQTMLEQGFRHLPVVEEDRAIGIVSIRDVVEWTVGDGDANAA